MWSSCFCKVCYHWERNQKLWWLTAQLRANHAIRPWALYKRNIAHILHENFWSWHGVQHKAPAFFKLPFLLNSLRFQQRQLLADVRLWRKVSFPWEFNVATVLRYVGLAALYWGGSFQTVVLSDVNFLLASFALQGSRRQDYRLCTSLLLARGALHSTTESHTTRRSWLRKISWSESDILFRGVVHVYIIYTHIIVWWLYIYIIWARHGFGPPPFQYFSVTLIWLLVWQLPIFGKPVMSWTISSYPLATSKRLPHDMFFWIFTYTYAWYMDAGLQIETPVKFLGDARICSLGTSSDRNSPTLAGEVRLDSGATQQEFRLRSLVSKSVFNLFIICSHKKPLDSN